MAPLGFAKRPGRHFNRSCHWLYPAVFRRTHWRTDRKKRHGNRRPLPLDKGAYLFAALNVLQLVGWTAVMIANGASTAGAVLNLGWNWVWSVIIGALIILWIVIGIEIWAS